MITILLPAACVAPGRLDMAGGDWRDPHVFIGGRNRQRADARQNARVADQPVMKIIVGEGFAGSSAPEAGGVLVDIDEIFAQARRLDDLARDGNEIFVRERSEHLRSLARARVGFLPNRQTASRLDKFPRPRLSHWEGAPRFDLARRIAFPLGRASGARLTPESDDDPRPVPPPPRSIGRRSHRPEPQPARAGPRARPRS